jgi:hypothetical protein
VANQSNIERMERACRQLRSLIVSARSITDTVTSVLRSAPQEELSSALGDGLPDDPCFELQNAVDAAAGDLDAAVAAMDAAAQVLIERAEALLVCRQENQG